MINNSDEQERTLHPNRMTDTIMYMKLKLIFHMKRNFMLFTDKNVLAYFLVLET